MQATGTGDPRLDIGARDAPARASAWTALTTSLCLGVAALGWSVRDELYLRPDRGAGYGLGILGATLILMLALYSARKRFRVLASWGPVALWFRVHMWLGVLAPVAILFHCNFQLGSLNSSLALSSMLLVAGSGVVGRSIYGKIHYGLYGRRVQLRDMRQQLSQAEGQLRPLLEVFPEVLEMLDSFEQRCTQPPRTALGALARLASLGSRARVLRRRCFGKLEPVLFEERRATRAYLALACRVGRFCAYERIFRLWHAVHVPMFVMLIFTLVLHVVAVHLY